MKPQHIILLIFLIAALNLLVFCQKATPPVKIFSEIMYSNSDDAYAQERCKLDLYVPQNQSDFPTLVWFHGGGLKKGTKNHPREKELGEYFAGKGIALAGVNYRLSPDANYPDYVEDAAAATAWVLNHIHEYNANPTRVFVSGHSAGGYLTAMIGVNPHFLQQHNSSSGKLAGLISISGQMYSHSTVCAERNLPDDGSVIDDSAPIRYTRVDTPPWLIICGEHDLTGRCEQNIRFADSLQTLGHPHVKYMEFPGRNHSTIRSEMTVPDDSVFQAIFAFIQP